ncbi:MAG: hypothetical protein V3T72_08190, partial [Thermoanaerobaculia bacterium]
FLSGMTRRGPWLCFSGMPTLTATNTLYTFRFKEDPGKDEKAAWALALLDARSAAATRSLGRRYADGLVKYEPGDLYKIPLTIPAKVDGSLDCYEAAVGEMLRDERSSVARSTRCESFSNGSSTARSRSKIRYSRDDADAAVPSSDVAGLEAVGEDRRGRHYGDVDVLNAGTIVLKEGIDETVRRSDGVVSRR